MAGMQPKDIASTIPFLDVVSPAGSMQNVEFKRAPTICSGVKYLLLGGCTNSHLWSCSHCARSRVRKVAPGPCVPHMQDIRFGREW